MSIAEIIAADPKLTPGQAAEYLNLPGPTLATWRCRGGGPSFLKLGATVRYSKADLDSWLASRRVMFTAQLPALMHGSTEMC